MLPYGCLVTYKLSIATYISPEIDFRLKHVFLYIGINMYCHCAKKNPIYSLAVIFIQNVCKD